MNNKLKIVSTLFYFSRRPGSSKLSGGLCKEGEGEGQGPSVPKTEMIGLTSDLVNGAEPGATFGLS